MLRADRLNPPHRQSDREEEPGTRLKSDGFLRLATEVFVAPAPAHFEEHGLAMSVCDLRGEEGLRRGGRDDGAPLNAFSTWLDGNTRTPIRHDEAFASSQADRDATLRAVHRLEAAAGTAAPGREAEWLERVLADLSALELSLRGEREESLQPDSLLSMIGRDFARRFGSRVRQLRDQLDDIVQQIASLQNQLAKAGEPTEVTDVRERLSWLVRSIHYRRARETDLVYEAVNLDLGRQK